MSKKELKVPTVFSMRMNDELREQTNELFPEDKDGNKLRGPHVHIEHINQHGETWVETVIGKPLSADEAIKLFNQVVIPSTDTLNRGDVLKACKKAPSDYHYKLVRVAGGDRDENGKQKFFTSLHVSEHEVAVG